MRSRRCYIQHAGGMPLEAGEISDFIQSKNTHTSRPLYFLSIFRHSIPENSNIAGANSAGDSLILSSNILFNIKYSSFVLFVLCVLYSTIKKVTYWRKSHLITLQYYNTSFSVIPFRKIWSSPSPFAPTFLS